MRSAWGPTRRTTSSATSPSTRGPAGRELCRRAEPAVPLALPRGIVADVRRRAAVGRRTRRIPGGLCPVPRTSQPRGGGQSVRQTFNPANIQHRPDLAWLVTGQSSSMMEKEWGESATIDRLNATSLTSCWVTTFCSSFLDVSASNPRRNSFRDSWVNSPLPLEVEPVEVEPVAVDSVDVIPGFMGLSLSIYGHLPVKFRYSGTILPYRRWPVVNSRISCLRRLCPKTVILVC